MHYLTTKFTTREEGIASEVELCEWDMWNISMPKDFISTNHSSMHIK